MSRASRGSARRGSARRGSARRGSARRPGGARSPGGARKAFTLVELIVVLALLVIVGGGVLSLLARQQRFYRGAADVVDQRSQLRQAGAILSADIRGLSSVGGDLVAMTDSSMDFRYTIGSSVLCVRTAASQFMIPPLTLARGNTLTSWSAAPTAGDSVFVYDDGADPLKSADDSWALYGINAVAASAGGCPASTGYTTAADAASNSYLVTTGGNYSGTILVGAPVRFVRRAHYSLYKNATDNKWYLGYCQNACTGSNAISPIAGPFVAYAPPGGTSSGIRISYRDKTGATTATAANVARISIVLRAQPSGTVNLSGYKYETKVDTLRINVAIRNRT